MFLLFYCLLVELFSCLEDAGSYYSETVTIAITPCHCHCNCSSFYFVSLSQYYILFVFIRGHPLHCARLLTDPHPLGSILECSLRQKA
jgi:hypothetical protein